MSLVYWLSRFSQEAMLIELFLIGVIGVCYFGYLLTKKRRYGVAKENIPDNVVRAFLIEMQSRTEGFKSQLFGENFKMPTGGGISVTTQPQITTQQLAAASAGDSGEITALKTQFAAAIAKQEELTKAIAALNAEKTALEGKLASAPAAGAAPVAGASAGGADPKALTEAQEKIAKLESKLAEYEVIEDDLANLKKYQQENKQLKTQLEAQKGGATPIAATPAPVSEPTPPTVAAEPAAPAAAPEPAAPSPIAAAEATVDANAAAAGFEGLVDKVEESLAAPAAGASVADPIAAPQAAAPPPVAEVPPAAIPAAPAAEAAPAAAAPPKNEKSDADLLNEFERMLSS